jgi:hypothetical protein
MSFKKSLLLVVVLLNFSDYASHAIRIVGAHLLAAAGLLVQMVAQIVSLFVEREEQGVLSKCFSFKHFSFEIVQVLLGDDDLLFLVVYFFCSGKRRVESSLLLGGYFLFGLGWVQIVYLAGNSLSALDRLVLLLHWLD